MKRDFMWYYTFMWMVVGGIGNFIDMLTVDVTAIWAIALVIPSILWLWEKSK